MFLSEIRKYCHSSRRLLKFIDGKGEGREHARRGILVGDIERRAKRGRRREREKEKERKKERRALTSLMCRGVEDRVFSCPEGSRLVTQILRG